MTSIRQGFFTSSSQAENQERKQNVTSSNLTSTSNQHSSQQQKNKQQKMTHTAMTSSSQRKQVKSTLNQKVLEFNPSGQMSMEQLIKVMLNLLEEVKKPNKENMKLTELINNGLQNMLDLRIINQEREIGRTKRLLARLVQPDNLLSLENASKKFSDREHSPKLKNLNQSTRIMRMQYGN